MNGSVDFAIIPAAGIGSRWKPLSSFIPKEMLPLAGKPVIEHVVREIIESGCKNIIIVISEDKKVVKNYLVSEIGKRDNFKLHFVYQDKPLGIADAMTRALEVIGENNFSLLFPDMPSFYKNTPPLKTAVDTFKKLPKDTHVLSFAKYPENITLFYGEFLLKKRKDNLFDVVHLCPRATSKKESHHKNSKYRGSGRDIFSPKIIPLIRKVLKNHSGKEVGDGEILELAFKTGQPFVGVLTEGFVFDTGTPELYTRANSIYEKLLTDSQVS